MFILQKLMVHIKLQTSLNSLLVDGLIKFIELIGLIDSNIENLVLWARSEMIGSAID